MSQCKLKSNRIIKYKIYLWTQQKFVIKWKWKYTLVKDNDLEIDTLTFLQGKLKTGEIADDKPRLEEAWHAIKRKTQLKIFIILYLNSKLY